MVAHLRRSVLLALIFLVLFGLVYPLVGTGIAQAFFKGKADGSITANGSTLIGQPWYSTRYFHGRPDAFGPYMPNPKNTPVCPFGVCGDNALQTTYTKKVADVPGNSATTNWGPRAQQLKDNTQALLQWWHQQGVSPTTDLVTTSGSGLDPDISPADARAQIPMVAGATGISPAALERLIAEHTHGAQLGFLGSPYVNVLELNEALARLR